MSSRALRKLHGTSGKDLPDLVQLPQSTEETESAEEYETPKKSKNKTKKKKAPINPFDLLNDEDHDGESLVASEENTLDQGKITQDPDLENTGTKKKNKKKRKKSKEVENAPKESRESEDEIDVSIREVNQLLGEMPSRVDTEKAGAQAAELKNLLNIEHKNLNPTNEMKRIFGSRVVQTDQNQVAHGNRRQRNRIIRKSTWLVQAKNTWPSLTKTGLSMSLVETAPNGQQLFAFEHNKDYQKVQFQFLDAVDSLEAQNIINMANLYPHHIDTLLQVSEVCRMSEDIQMATDFIERALYVFECAFHPLFSLTQGNARLDYRRQENRAFYIALFRHLNFIGKRGCYKTSLEFCKLLLSFDPDNDPLCVLLMIDFFALRAEQYDFLIKMYEEWEADRNLSQLPNFAFSVALAMYYKSKEDHRESDFADDMLQKSLLMYPGLLMPLLDKCSIAPDDQVSSNAFFGAKAQLYQPKALEQLIGLYIGRTFSCWKEAEVVSWLEKNVKQVLDRVDQKDPLVDDYMQKRMSRYQGTPRNIHRHIMISEIKEAFSAMPPDLANTPVMSYDPLPPPDSICAYQRPQRSTMVQQNSNPLAMFFQSLMPNFNPQEVVREVPQGAAGGQAQNFREGVVQVMDAMRDLLNNIRPIDPPIENDHDDNQGDDNAGFEDHEWD